MKKKQSKIIIEMIKNIRNITVRCASGSPGERDDLLTYKGKNFLGLEKRYPFTEEKQVKRDIDEMRKYWEDKGEQVIVKESQEENDS